MQSTRVFVLRLVAVIAAFILALSGVGVADTIGESQGAGKAKQSSAQRDADAQSKKCKKGKKGKKGKKCKKKKSPEAPPAGAFVPGRVVEIEYTGSAIGSQDTPATIYPFGPVFPVNFIAGAGETHAMIEIVDAAGPNASAGFSWDTDGDGLNDTGFDVCGSTEEPVELPVGTQVNIFPYLLPSTTCTDAVATTGTITVTFNKV